LTGDFQSEAVAQVMDPSFWQSDKPV